MKCPGCEDTMKEGKLAIVRSRLDDGLLQPRAARSIPLSAIEFEPSDGATVSPRLSGGAWLCPSCDMVVLEGYASLDCFECGANIPGNVDACPKCGWSWK
jgi:hypothetical protein